ncbi:MAG: AAA family ATPase [Acidobacteriota bacterium]|nr:AAA family ATPase [Acidobacteriota bacterium]
MGRNPFTAGRWVRGSQFFGRETLINDLLHSDEPCNWVIGKRRMGKTSLLREMERRINNTDPGRLALFWDLQGSFDGEGLFDSLYDALEDSQDEYSDCWDGIEFDAADEESCSQILKKLARLLSRRSRSLVLLMDETEELITVGKHDAGLLSKLRRFLQTNRHTQTIMVSSPRLEMLGRTVETNTSPFLHGFIAFYLGNFELGASERLLRQGIDDTGVITRIQQITGGNPFETQLVAKHYFEDDDLERALIQLETNPTLNQTTEVNFNLLTEDEQQLLKAAHCGPAPFQEFEKAIIAKLLRMGYLAEDVGGGLKVSSYFQAKWLSNNLMTEAEASPAHVPEVVSGVVLSVNHKSTILQQIVAIYKTFLELAQNGQRIAQKDGAFVVSDGDTIVLNRKSLQLEPAETGDARPWWTAVTELSAFLDQFLDRKESWSIFRFHQMAEKGPDHYAEKDFLDLMMLIAEESVLC